jgi:hypothetical protein
MVSTKPTQSKRLYEALHLQAVHGLATDEVVGTVNVVEDGGDQDVVAVVASR